jgi:hypothetical protein
VGQMQRRNGLPLPFLIVGLYARLSRRCSSCSVSFMALNGDGHVSHELGGEQSLKQGR